MIQVVAYTGTPGLREGIVTVRKKLRTVAMSLIISVFVLEIFRKKCYTVTELAADNFLPKTNDND